MSMRKMKSIEDHLKTKKNQFSIGLLVFEGIMIIFYGFFLRMQPINEGGSPFQSAFVSDFYSIFQDVNVMMLVGFGFLMTYIKTYSWSALSYTFLTYAVVVQFYFLASGFWAVVFHGGWGEKILLSQSSLTSAVYCVAAVLISLGGVLGRISMLHMLIMAILETIAYTLNEFIVYEVLKVYDVGGSTAIHTFGAVVGLVVCFIISHRIRPTKSVQISHNSMIFSYIGTFFLFLYWPSFNSGLFPVNNFERQIIVVNTVISLTGSCIGTFMTTSYGRKKFSIEEVLNATLAGGVMIGASAGLIVNPAASLTIGFLAGIISSLGYHYLTDFLQEKIGLYDSCGINNLHGIPGILGGFTSAIVIAAYGASGLSVSEMTQLNFASNTFQGRTFNAQAGIQIAGTFCSFGIALVTGLIIGGIIYATYQYKSGNQYYEDSYDFDVPENKNKSSNPAEIMLQSAQTLKSEIDLPRASIQFQEKEIVQQI